MVGGGAERQKTWAKKTERERAMTGRQDTRKGTSTKRRRFLLSTCFWLLVKGGWGGGGEESGKKQPRITASPLLFFLLVFIPKITTKKTKKKGTKTVQLNYKMESEQVLHGVQNKRQNRFNTITLTGSVLFPRRPGRSCFHGDLGLVRLRRKDGRVLCYKMTLLR